MDSMPLFRRTPSAGLTRGWLLKGNTGSLCLSDDLHMCLPAAIERRQFFQCRDGKEIPVQKEQTISKGAGGTVSILYHLYHMGSGTDMGAILSNSGPEPVMEADGKRDAGPLFVTAGKDAEAAEHMAMDIFRLCGVFRFLEQLFHSGHPASFF